MDHDNEYSTNITLLTMYIHRDKPTNWRPSPAHITSPILGGNHHAKEATGVLHSTTVFYRECHDYTHDCTALGPLVGPRMTFPPLPSQATFWMPTDGQGKPFIHSSPGTLKKSPEDFQKPPRGSPGTPKVSSKQNLSEICGIVCKPHEPAAQFV